jgi:hypothetical protein
MWISTQCDICGLQYVKGHNSDTRLHDRVHTRWLEVAAEWGIDPVWSSHKYEALKIDCSRIFNDSLNPLHVRVEAAEKYLQLRWVHGVWTSVRFNSYATFIKKYPTKKEWVIDKWGSDNSHVYGSEIQTIIHRRYGIIP